MVVWIFAPTQTTKICAKIQMIQWFHFNSHGNLPSTEIYQNISGIKMQITWLNECNERLLVNFLKGMVIIKVQNIRYEKSHYGLISYLNRLFNN